MASTALVHGGKIICPAASVKTLSPLPSGGGSIVPARIGDKRHRGMKHTWYVTFEVPTDGTLSRRRHPRLTKTFETEAAAKDFARIKFSRGTDRHRGDHHPPPAESSDPVGENSSLA